MKKSLLGIVGACLLVGVVKAEAPVQVKASAPERYTVVKGDTLWGIASRYLSDPWRWPEIWEANKKVYNPHLIYPGDVLLLCHIKDKTVLAVDQGGGCKEITGRIASGESAPPPTTQMPDGTVKLHPQAREQSLSLAIPAIPLKEIQRYLNDSRVVSKEELERAPYVISGRDNRLMAGAGDGVFVRNKGGLLEREGAYGVYRAGVAYVDPDTKELLGYEAEDIGSGKIIGLQPEVGTLQVSRTTKEMHVGDKLLQNEKGQISALFHPANPEGVKPGQVLRLFNSLASAAQYSVIVVNRGEGDNVKPGHTFALYHRSGAISDPISKEMVKLPDERVGMAMVFRTFPRVSYALILNSTTPIKVGDEVRPPIDGD